VSLLRIWYLLRSDWQVFGAFPIKPSEHIAVDIGAHLRT
jgi:hypothetical protein